MKYPLICVWALFVCVHATKDCTVPGGDEASSYREDVLATGVKASRIIVNWKTNKLYFNYQHLSKGMLTAVLDLDKKTYTDIGELTGTCTFAVDQDSGNVYAGCRNDAGRGGLYKYDSKVKRFVVMGEKGKAIYFVYYGNDVLYYTKSNSSDEVFTYANGRIRTVPQLKGYFITDLVVNRAGDWVYRANAVSLFHKSRVNGLVTRYTRGLVVSSLAMSPRGEVYVCNYKRKTIDRAESDGTTYEVAVGIKCYGLAVDASGHRIYVDGKKDKIIHLIDC